MKGSEFNMGKIEDLKVRISYLEEALTSARLKNDKINFLGYLGVF
jgi:hypothetical protein